MTATLPTPGQFDPEDLRALADRLTESGVAGDVPDMLYEAADALTAAQAPLPEPAAVRLCGKREHGRAAPCDRPTRHEGECSWAPRRLHRLLREHDTTVRALAASRRSQEAWQARARYAESAALRLQEELTRKRRWPRRPKADA